MGWAYDYLKSKRKHKRKEQCPKRKEGKHHKLEFFFGNTYCSKCGIELSN